MELHVQELTAEAFTRFGVIIEQPVRSQDAQGPGWSWWGENAYLDSDHRPYGIGYLDLVPADLTFDWAERHMHSQEMLIPAQGDCLVYVGPSLYPEEPGKMPGVESVEVFRIRPGQAAILNKGVWHGAPLAIREPAKVIVLLLKNSGAEDCYVVRFEEDPVRIRLDQEKPSREV